MTKEEALSIIKPWLLRMIIKIRIKLYMRKRFGEKANTFIYKKKRHGLRNLDKIDTPEKNDLFEEDDETDIKALDFTDRQLQLPSLNRQNQIHMDK